MSNKNGFFKGKSRIALLLLIDVACIAIASWFFLFRYQMANRLSSISTLAMFFVTMLASIQVSRFIFRVYLQVWRYASSDVYLRMVLADLVGGMLYIGIDRPVFPQPLPFQYAWQGSRLGC